MTTINLINLLDFVFTTSFKHTSRMLYSVSFETSNVLKTTERLKELEYNFTNGISTGKHVGAEITIDDIRNVVQTLDSLIHIYKSMFDIQSIPSKLKIHEMTKEIRENVEKLDIKNLAVEVVLEILQPQKTEKKLTKKEKMKELANKRSLERQIGMIKKLDRLKD